MTGQRDVVAVVDDSEMMRDALDHLLSLAGYRAELFDSAEAFLRDASTSEACCLVVDIQLGDISGIELARQLAANGFEFPIIFMTGSSDDVVRRQALELGCVAYLHKPFPVDQLIEAIMKATGSLRPGSGPHTTMPGVGK